MQSGRAIVIGASAGGGQAFEKILSGLPVDYAVPILIVQHLSPDDGDGFAQNLGRKTRLPVVSTCDKQKIDPGRIYVAPANYHLLIERSGYAALSVENKVRWSRPSIDVLFESAAYALNQGVIAILLTGSNEDGVQGMRTVQSLGGLTIAQQPATAEYSVMPQAAIDAEVTQMVLTLDQIAEFLAGFSTKTGKKSSD